MLCVRYPKCLFIYFIYFNRVEDATNNTSSHLVDVLRKVVDRVFVHHPEGLGAFSITARNLCQSVCLVLRHVGPGKKGRFLN